LHIKQSWISQERRELQKFYQRGYIVILNYLCNAIEKTFGEISLHRHFNNFCGGERHWHVYWQCIYNVSSQARKCQCTKSVKRNARRRAARGNCAVNLVGGRQRKVTTATWGKKRMTILGKQSDFVNKWSENVPCTPRVSARVARCTRESEEATKNVTRNERIESSETSGLSWICF
jgi:hypothetical protein